MNGKTFLTASVLLILATSSRLFAQTELPPIGDLQLLPAEIESRLSSVDRQAYYSAKYRLQSKALLVARAKQSKPTDPNAIQLINVLSEGYFESYARRERPRVEYQI